MKKTNTAYSLRYICLVLIVMLSLAALTSCGSSVADKETIYERMENTPSDNTEYTYVVDYLTSWGIRNVDWFKFEWVESKYQSFYAYGDGLPTAVEHARMVATAFLDNYYDVIDLKDRTTVTDALLLCYSDTVDDPYSIYRAPEEYEAYYEDMSGSFGGVGMTVIQDDIAETITVTSVYDDSPAKNAGILPGDVLYAVNGETVAEIGYVNVLDRVRGKVGTSVNVIMKRGEEYLSFSMVRAIIQEKSVEYEIDTENNIAYIRVSGFKSNTVEQFVLAVDAAEEAGVSGIIFDMRSNPGGYLYVVKDMISYLVPTGHDIVSYQYSGSIKVFDKSLDDIHPTKKDDDGKPVVSDHKISVPVVVICNQYTASAGELFTAAIRDYDDENLIDATIVGTTTYKKGIMQQSYTYNLDGSSVTFTVAYYNPPCGDNYHGIGVVPDVEVTNTETEDLQYAKAVEELLLLINK